ncbi:MAG TPA: SAM-dependent chlorinase/fluorinase [Thermoplasmata archaeon]|nr:SAM-dependent chlorinase/fluorinase [Thermoplasmata archaeon]
MSGRKVRRLVTLSTDIGWAYAAQIKSVLLRDVPPERIVDLAHDLPAHQVDASSFLLREMARRFPSGTVHLAVVDPGVGGRRAPVAIACREGSYLVGPDNGLLAPLAELFGVREVRRIRPRAGPRVGATFDGRDLFAPAAAALAIGRRFSTLGPRSSLHRRKRPLPSRTRSGLDGRILWVDPFGNLITDLPSEWWPSSVTRARLVIHGRSWPLVTVRVYEELGSRALGVLPSSFGLLEVAARERPSSARTFGAVGDRLRLEFARPPAGASGADAIPPQERK